MYRGPFISTDYDTGQFLTDMKFLHFVNSTVHTYASNCGAGSSMRPRAIAEKINTDYTDIQISLFAASRNEMCQFFCKLRC